MKFLLFQTDEYSRLVIEEPVLKYSLQSRLTLITSRSDLLDFRQETYKIVRIYEKSYVSLHFGMFFFGSVTSFSIL